MRWWPWSRKSSAAAPRPRSFTLDDPSAVPYFAGGTYDESGLYVGEGTAMHVSAFFRGVAVIAQTLAALPLNTWSQSGDVRRRVPSVFDDPGGEDGPTPFEWKETGFLHALLHGNAYGRIRRNVAGGIYSIDWVHPLFVQVEWARPAGEIQPNGGYELPRGGKWFTITYSSGPHRDVVTEVLDATDVLHVPSLSLDGLTGLSLLGMARRGLTIAMAGDKAASRMLTSGAMISGIVTPDEDLEPEEVPQIKSELLNSTGGWNNAGTFAVVNRKLNFTPWTMTAADAQFLQSRQFSIEEIARWTGVPPHLLMQTSKVSSWGTGIAEQNEGLARYSLNQWSVRFEQRFSRRLARPRSVEFDYAALKRPAYADEVELLLKMTGRPIAVVNEARARLGMEPVDGGDDLASVPGSMPAGDGQPEPADDLIDQEEGGDDAEA